MDAFSCGGGRHKWLSVAVNNSHFSLLLNFNSALESIILGNYCMALICYARHGLDTRIHRHRSRRSVTGVPRANQLHSPVIQ